MSDKKNFRKILKKLEGRFSIEAERTDHYRFDIIYNGQVVMHLNQSYGVKDDHFKLWGRNLHIGETDTKNFIECSLSIEKYIEKIVKKGVIQISNPPIATPVARQGKR